MQTQTTKNSSKKVKTWTIGASTFSAAPELGARLMQWDLNLAHGPSRNIIYWPEDANLSQIDKVRGGNPILFPFIARTFHKGKENHWSPEKNTVLPMPRHGFCRNGQFEITQTTDSGFIAKLLPTVSDIEAYPFNYTFSVQYIFSELSFEVNLILENHSKTRIPWCPGHHFYFNLPWHEGLNRSHYHVDIPTKKAFNAGSGGKLTPANNFTMPCSFDDPAIIDRIHCRLKNNSMKFGLKNDEEFITIKIGDSSPPSTWNSITTWTLDDNSPFYCVEPWMGLPNSPEHEKGLSYVEAGATQTFNVTVSL